MGNRVKNQSITDLLLDSQGVIVNARGVPLRACK